MTHIVPNPDSTSTPETTQPPSRRQVLAFLALADVPIPETIRFSDEYPTHLHIDAGDDRSLAPFMRLFSGASLTEKRQRYDNETYDKHGYIVSVNRISWRGWTVTIRTFATDGVSHAAAEDLNADTRTQLAALAGTAADR